VVELCDPFASLPFLARYRSEAYPARHPFDFVPESRFQFESSSKPDKQKKSVSTKSCKFSSIQSYSCICLVVGLCLGLGRDYWSASISRQQKHLAYCMGSLGWFVHQVLYYQSPCLKSLKRDSLSRATACSFATPTHVRTEAIAKGQRGLASC